MKPKRNNRQDEQTKNSRIDFFHQPPGESSALQKETAQSSVPVLPPVGGASPKVIMQESPRNHPKLDSSRKGKKAKQAKKNKISSTSQNHQSIGVESNAYEEANDESIKPFSFTSPHSPS